MRGTFSWEQGDKVLVCDNGRWKQGEVLWLCGKDPEAYCIETRDGSRGNFDLDHIAPNL